MIWFWGIAGLLIAAALTVLLIRSYAGPPRGRRSRAVVAVFRRELANLDTEIAQGRLGPEEAGTARA